MEFPLISSMFPLKFQENWQQNQVAVYLDCPAIKAELPVLHCPNASAVASFKAAVRRGDIWWHAFPHNAELAAADAGMIKAGVNITHTLDARFGLTSKRTLSQRDVPGISRATLPILSAAGVPYISIGTNNGPYKREKTHTQSPAQSDFTGDSDIKRKVLKVHKLVLLSFVTFCVFSAVSLPNAFVWREPSSGTEAIVTWHAFGYGSIEDRAAGTTGAWEDCEDGYEACEDGLGLYSK